MGRTVCTGPQCLYKGAIYLLILWRWKRQSVPKRPRIKFRHRGITQKKGYDIHNTVKVLNQENVHLSVPCYVFQLNIILTYIIPQVYKKCDESFPTKPVPRRMIGFLNVCMYKDGLINSIPVCLFVFFPRISEKYSISSCFLHRNPHW
jgi:hypothetical protein